MADSQSHYGGLVELFDGLGGHRQLRADVREDLRLLPAATSCRIARLLFPLLCVSTININHLYIFALWVNPHAPGIPLALDRWPVVTSFPLAQNGHQSLKANFLLKYFKILINRATYDFVYWATWIWCGLPKVVGHWSTSRPLAFETYNILGALSYIKTEPHWGARNTGRGGGRSLRRGLWVRVERFGVHQRSPWHLQR